MRVLVACEESQRVCGAFRAKGHLAYSCDLQDCSGGHPEWHIKGDCKAVIEHNSWDLIIAHPPCTYLSNAGACNMYKYGQLNIERYEKLLAAREFFMYFYNLEGVKVCIENPKPMRLADLPMHSQVIQPYEFGDNFTKMTLLWLKGLPLLFPLCYGENKRSIDGIESWTSLYRDAKMRSKTFNGIAIAMAEQWG